MDLMESKVINPSYEHDNRIGYVPLQMPGPLINLYLPEYTFYNTPGSKSHICKPFIYPSFRNLMSICSQFSWSYYKEHGSY
jgi:hypothetical protein